MIRRISIAFVARSAAVLPSPELTQSSSSIVHRGGLAKVKYSKGRFPRRAPGADILLPSLTLRGPGATAITMRAAKILGSTGRAPPFGAGVFSRRKNQTSKLTRARSSERRTREPATTAQQKASPLYSAIMGRLDRVRPPHVPPSGEVTGRGGPSKKVAVL